MQNLLPGLRKFSEQVFPKQQQLFKSLSQGQKPHTLMITCSDSRIDPLLVTQTQPGEIFVVRNAGNIIPPFGAASGGEEAAIEFAVDGLGVRNIIVFGHSQCGAMAALVNRVDLDSLPSVKAWLSHAQKTLKPFEQLQDECDLVQVAQENVLVQAAQLRTHPSVASALAAGRVQIFGWVYHFESGTVYVYDPREKRFLPSVEVKAAAAEDVSRFAL